jgi:muramidase (phage lysozyme)
MAEITQKVQGVNPTSYIGLSKEPDRVRPNTGFGELFKGIGSLAEGAVTAIDEKNKEDISKSLYGGVDDIHKELGVDVAAEAGAVKTPLFTGNENNQNVNPAVAETVERNTESLSRLKTALEQGKISQMYYAQRSEALVRNLRAQYPGYREFIDDKVSKITGMKPANTIIREITGAIEARRTSAQQSAEKEITFIRGKMEHLSPEEREEAIAGGWNDPIKRSKYMKSIGDREAMISSIDVAKKGLELKAKQGDVVEGDIVGYLQNYSHKMVTMQLDKAYRELNPLLKGLQEGKPIPPESVVKVRAAIEALKLEAIKQFDSELSSSYGDGTKNFLQTLPPAKIKELKDQMEKRFGDIIESVEKGDLAMIKVDQTFNRMRVDSDSRKIIEGSPYLRQLEAFKQILGPQGFTWLLQSPEAHAKNIKEVTKAFNTALRAQMFSKGEDLGTMLKGLTKNAETFNIDQNEAKKIATGVLDDAVKKLADPKVDPAFFEKMVTSVFGSGDSTKAWTELFKSEERQAWFKKFTSPDIMKNLDKIKGTEAAKHVQLFVERTARANLQTSADSIVDKVTEPGGAVSIEIDPKTGRLRPVQTRKLTEQERALGGRFGPNPGSAITPSFQKEVDKMNENIDILKRQYTMMGLDPMQEIQAFLQAVGINETNPRRANVWQMMLNRLTDREGNTQVDETTGNPVQKQNLNPEIQPQRFGTGTTPPNIQMTNMFGNEEGPVSVQQIDSYVEKRAQEIKASLGISRDDFLDTNKSISLAPNAKFDGSEEEYVSLKSDTSTDYKNLTASTPEKTVLNLVASAESGKNGYNKIFGGKTLNLTSMSVGDVLATQREMIRNGSPSSALGRYQFINKTLKGLISDLGIPLNATFNEELQDKLGVALMKRRGWDKFKSGKMTEDQFLNNLAKEWAGLPTTKGTSFYAGDGLNRATVSLAKVRSVIKRLATKSESE